MTEAERSGSFLQMSLGEFLDLAGARRATPGGGSIAALGAALAVSMARMVLAYSRGRKAVAEHRSKLDELEAALAALDTRARPLIDADAEAYQSYRAAVREAGDSAAPAVHQALRRAIEVPLQVLRCCTELLEMLSLHHGLLNPRLRSDVLVATHQALAAGRSASENVQVNVGSLPDRDDANRLLSTCKELLDTASSHARAVESAGH